MTPAMKKWIGIKKWILRPLLIVVVSLVLLVGIGIALLYAQHDRIVNIALKELNEQFHGELTVETTSISLFKHFPSVGVALHGATLYGDKTKSGDPIFKIEKLYVGVSVPDLLDNKYNLRRLSLHNGTINVVKETDGTLNIVEAFNVHSDTTSTASTDSSAYIIDLQKVTFKGLDLSFLDRASGQRYSSKIEDLASQFKVDSTTMSIVLNSKMELDWISPKDTSLFRHRHHRGLRIGFESPSHPGRYPETR